MAPRARASDAWTGGPPPPVTTGGIPLSLVVVVDDADEVVVDVVEAGPARPSSELDGRG